MSDLSVEKHLRRNKKEMPLIPNGSNRPGQQPWHDANCQMEDWGFTKYYPPHRQLWCATHGQWAHEVPITVTFKFADGTEIVKKGGA